MPAEISVIIAAYNVEAYIERAIRSAIEGQGAEAEIIVVNDASTDGTASVAARINDPRVKIINLAANSGPGVARNAGIAAAATPWIAILDGDDAFLPGRLARCLMRAKMLNADIIVDNIQVHREADDASFPMFAPVAFSRRATITLAGFIAGNQSFLGGEALGYLKPVFAAAFLRQHNLAYDPALRIGEDYLLFAEALAKDALCGVEGTLGYLYTVRAGSISHRLSLADVERIAEGDKQFLARHSLDPAAAEAQKRRTYALKEAYAFTNLIDAIKRCNVRDACKAIAMYPLALRNLWRPAWARIGRIFKRA